MRTSTEIACLTVNGDRREVGVPTHFTLLETLRYVIGLTGLKQGCDKGDCGACTVILDGEPTLSCITPVWEAEGRAVTTVFTDAEHGRAGLHDEPSLLDYRIPTSLDTPEFESLIVESIDPEGPYGAKEAGEGPLHPAIPAIANAIYDAVGVRMDRLPLSPPNVWREIEAARAAATLVKPGVPSGAGTPALAPEQVPGD